jgi:hypothetical protein
MMWSIFSEITHARYCGFEMNCFVKVYGLTLAKNLGIYYYSKSSAFPKARSGQTLKKCKGPSSWAKQSGTIELCEDA